MGQGSGRQFRRLIRDPLPQFSNQIAPNAVRLASHWSIYSSEKDSALRVSTTVNQAKRLGQPVAEVENVKVIDASGLSVNPWSIPDSHSYYATSEIVIDDIVAVLKKEPVKREQHEINGYVYWKLQE